MAPRSFIAQPIALLRRELAAGGVAANLQQKRLKPIPKIKIFFKYAKRLFCATKNGQFMN